MHGLSHQQNQSTSSYYLKTPVVNMMERRFTQRVDSHRHLPLSNGAVVQEPRIIVQCSPLQSLRDSLYSIKEESREPLNSTDLNQILAPSSVLSSKMVPQSFNQSPFKDSFDYRHIMSNSSADNMASMKDSCL